MLCMRSYWTRPQLSRGVRAQLPSAEEFVKKSPPAASPDAYIAALTGWRRACVEELRAAVHAAAALEETIKWGNLVYLAGGPVLVIRTEKDRVLLSYWRGQRLRALEPRLRPGGKYEMATLDLREGMSIDAATVKRLAKEAAGLNRKVGNPTLDAKA